jgi:hypothetical protein
MRQLEDQVAEGRQSRTRGGASSNLCTAELAISGSRELMLCGIGSLSYLFASWLRRWFGPL